MSERNEENLQEILMALMKLAQAGYDKPLDMANAFMRLGEKQGEGTGLGIIVIGFAATACGLDNSLRLDCLLSTDTRTPKALLKRVLDNVSEELTNKMAVETKEGDTCTCGLGLTPHGTHNRPH